MGFFDGLNGAIGIIPVTHHGEQTFKGEEYLNLYPYVDVTEHGNANERKLWIRRSVDVYASLGGWIRRTRPIINSLGGGGVPVAEKRAKAARQRRLICQTNSPEAERHRLLKNPFDSDPAPCH